MIEDKEEAFRNVKKTATEEKKVMEEIRKMKNSLKCLPEMEKLQAQRDGLKKQLDEKKKEQRKYFVVIDKLKAEQKIQFAILDANKEEQKTVETAPVQTKTETEEKTDGKKVKKQREFTKEEQNLFDQKESIVKDI